MLFNQHKFNNSKIIHVEKPPNMFPTVFEIHLHPGNNNINEI